MNNIVPLPLPEPPVIALDAHDDLTMWRFDDGSIVIRIGFALQLGAETILLESHHVEAVRFALNVLEGETP